MPWSDYPILEAEIARANFIQILIYFSIILSILKALTREIKLLFDFSFMLAWCDRPPE